MILFALDECKSLQQQGIFTAQATISQYQGVREQANLQRCGQS
ncbi:unnamed protein product [Paramecium octaurelia]|uniref:Uncharacterized protein n=1 Tax=Paramecium octaurelia TaxID=43137 RepID=A0A8S1V5B3_PAROT|nr:unnamed protein product [Paramecium octaurelia]